MNDGVLLIKISSTFCFPFLFLLVSYFFIRHQRRGNKNQTETRGVLRNQQETTRNQTETRRAPGTDRRCPYPGPKRVFSPTHGPDKLLTGQLQEMPVIGGRSCNMRYGMRCKLKGHKSCSRTRGCSVEDLEDDEDLVERVDRKSTL